MYKIYNNILFVNICLWVSCVMIPKLMTLYSLWLSGRWLGLLAYETLNILACCNPSYNMVLKYCNFEEYSICIFCGP